MQVGHLWQIFEHFLAGTAFRYFWFPIIGCLFGLAIKLESRPDGQPRSREDYAAGLDLVQGSLLMLVALTIEKAVDLDSTYRFLDAVKNPVEQAKLGAHARIVDAALEGSGVTIFLMCMLLWGATSSVRRRGWEPDPAHPQEKRMRVFRGILFPYIVGLSTLYLVAWFLSS